jgi:hypothetical protein
MPASPTFRSRIRGIVAIGFWPGDDATAEQPVEIVDIVERDSEPQIPT